MIYNVDEWAIKRIDNVCSMCDGSGRIDGMICGECLTNVEQEHIAKSRAAHAKEVDDAVDSVKLAEGLVDAALSGVFLGTLEESHNDAVHRRKVARGASLDKLAKLAKKTGGL